MMKRLNPLSSSVCTGLFFFSQSISAEQTEFSNEALAFFESKIRPVFVAKCYNCHSHEAKKLKGGLYMDSREGLMVGGDSGASIVPGDPKASLLLEAIHYKDPDLQMPPKTKLSPKSIQDIEKWIADGAAWPKETTRKIDKKGIDIAARLQSHWSWTPLSNPPAPTVQNQKSSNHPVDLFIQKRLEEEKLKPSKSADKHTLVRRLYFVLHGLPPTPEQIDAFVKDDQPGAYERLIDQLLASPRFGERWARHWLDLVRYAESRGHEFDYNAANAYRYRDYVIRAINKDVPYDQLVHEHIAGDLLPNPRLHPEEKFNESVLGTGFWLLGEWVHSPVDTRQDEADRYDNMIDVATKTFLGLTVACARCHDHKFDAITAKDYYAFSGFLQSSNYRQVRYESMEHNKKIAQQLDKLEQTEGKEAWRAWLDRPTQDNTEHYLLAARDVLQKGISFEASDISLEPGADITFADFEDGTYLGWSTTGDAFGEGPVTEKTKASYQKNIKQQGTYFVNSHYIRGKGRGDGHKGTLTSGTFKIERDYITFLIGGGSHKKQTCLNLLVDGKVVSSATGDNNNTMRRKFWDVRQYQGMEASIQAVDNHTSGWGNIGFDDILFTNHRPKAATSVATDPIDRNFSTKTLANISNIAEKHKLNSITLLHWVKALMKAEKDAASPLHLLAKSRNGKVPLDQPASSAVDDTLNKALQELKTVINYSTAPTQHFLQDGYTFGPRVVKAGDILWSSNPKQPIDGIASYGMARKDPAWHGMRIIDSELDAGSGLRYERAGTTLRTPTFKLEEGRLWYLVKGEATAMAVVNSHRLVQGPLHGNTKANIGNPDKLAWYSHALDKKGQTFVGERIHVEFTPKGKNFEVLMVAQGDQREARDLILRHYQNTSQALKLKGNTYEELALALNNQLPAGNLTWVLNNPELFPEANPATFPLVQKFVENRNALLAQIQKESRIAMAMQDGSAEDEKVFIRGNPRTLGEDAPRSFLEALGGKPVQSGGSGRLELAHEITSPKNPYTSRVMANRIWHHLFGRGIVPTTNDFGVLGQTPSHPELLDHLATKFIEKDWSVKELIRYILKSQTWQMTSEASNTVAETKDPTNKLLHRMPIRRMEGEAIRDALLTVSGKLTTDLYGKPTPIYLNSFMTGRGRPGSGPLDGNGRRIIYLSVRRNFLSPLMLSFDTPIPFNSVGRRTVSNVPSQSLMLMNDPFIRSQVKLWGDRYSKSQEPIPNRIQKMYHQAYSRDPQPEELEVVTAFLQEQIKTDPANAWSTLAHVLVSAKEFIYIQ